MTEEEYLSLARREYRMYLDELGDGCEWTEISLAKDNMGWTGLGIRHWGDVAPPMMCTGRTLDESFGKWIELVSDIWSVESVEELVLMMELKGY